MRIFSLMLIAIIIISIIAVSHTLIAQVFRLDYPEVGITILDKNVGDHDWSADGKYLAYTKRNLEDWYFDIWIVTPEGTGYRCLSSTWPQKEGFPKKHVGGVTWHPSGEYLAFAAQNNDATGKRIDTLATPGTGLNCNLCIMKSDGTRVWQLTDIKTDYIAPHGIIHPQFSNDGKKLFWAEAIGSYSDSTLSTTNLTWGIWTLATGDFVMENGAPILKNIERFQPGEQKMFYETHDFSPDDSRALFCGNLEKGQPLNGIDIYELNLKDKSVKRLTSTFNDWDEHAHYSSDNKNICWMSGKGFDVKFETLRCPDWANYVKTELWLMNSNGSNQRRITSFNEPGHPDHEWFAKNIYDSPRIIVSDNSWSPDGKKIATALAFEAPNKVIGSIFVLLDLEKREPVKLTNDVKIKKISEGIYPKWSHTKNLISFNKVVNGRFEIFTMKPDGSDVRCLTSDKPALSTAGNRGQPYWHPNGEYIVFTAENANHKRTAMGLGLAEMPGIGRNHNVWIMKSDGSQFWQLTDYPENWGVFRPSFSHNGRMLYWNEEYSMEKYPGIGSSWKWPGSFAPWIRANPIGEEWGLIRIKIGDISLGKDGPKISNIRNIVHSGLTLLEGSGFTPDDKGFIFTSADTGETGGSAYWGGDIYTSGLNGGSIKRLTNTPYLHDENMEYSPDGKRIIWTQAKGSPGDRQDICIMDRDGKNKTRLTYFNEPGHPEYIPDACGGCGEMDWSPDGKDIIFAFGMGKQPEYPYFRYDLFMLTFEGI